MAWTLERVCAQYRARRNRLQPGHGSPFCILALDQCCCSGFLGEAYQAAVRNATEIETVLADLGRQPGGGLIVMPDASNAVHRQLMALAAQHRVPAIFYRRYFATGGGLMGPVRRG